MSQEIEDEITAQRHAISTLKNQLESYQDLLTTSLGILSRLATRLDAENDNEPETPIATMIDSESIWIPQPITQQDELNPRNILQELSSLSLRINSKLDETDMETVETVVGSTKFAIQDSMAVPGTVCIFIRDVDSYLPCFAPNSPISKLSLPLSTSEESIIWVKIVTRHGDKIRVKEWKWKRNVEPSEIILHHHTRPLVAQPSSIRSKSPY
jgi:hypothetical protein